MNTVPKPYPQEFRDDVVRVAQNREDGVTLEQIAADFGIHPMTLNKWIRKADVEAGIKPGTTSAESRELREAKRRVRLLEQENEVLRRAAARGRHARQRQAGQGQRAGHERVLEILHRAVSLGWMVERGTRGAGCGAFTACRPPKNRSATSGAMASW